MNLGRGIGGNLTAPSVGFLPLLRDAAGIANQQQNVAALERLLRLYEAFREGGQQSDLQVGQVEIDLLNSRGAAARRGRRWQGGGGGGGIRGYLDQLDNFKLQLGLAADGAARPRQHAAQADPPAARPVRGRVRGPAATGGGGAEVQPGRSGRRVPPALAAAA